MKFICEKIMKTILLTCCWENRKKKDKRERRENKTYSVTLFQKLRNKIFDLASC